MVDPYKELVQRRRKVIVPEQHKAVGSVNGSEQPKQDDCAEFGN